MPVTAAWRIADSVHKSPSTCRGEGRYWLSLPLEKEERHRENVMIIYKGDKKANLLHCGHETPLNASVLTTGSKSSHIYSNIEYFKLVTSNQKRLSS